MTCDLSLFICAADTAVIYAELLIVACVNIRAQSPLLLGSASVQEAG